MWDSFIFGAFFYHEIDLVTCELQEVGVLVDAGCSNRECCICHAPVTDLGSRRQRLCDVGTRF